MARIFLSYRREDAGGHARHLFEHLASRYGKKAVFMDVATLQGGEAFVDRIDQEVGRSDVFLALIGKRWLEASDDAGRRRLDAPEDYVRREVAAALARNVKTIPVLVDGAAMPRKEALPPDIEDLTLRNAVELSSARWDYELERLLELLPPPPRRWILRSAMGAGAAVVLFSFAVVLRGLFWPAPEPMTGIFNVAVLDFGEKESSDAKVHASAEGRWIADRVYDGLRDLDAKLRLEGDTGGVVDIGRLERTVQGRSATDVAHSLVEIADEVNATIVVHGVLDMSGPPYRFTPTLYLTEEFNGGEELTGENAFGSPIEVRLPLNDTGRGPENRLALAEKLRSRLEALQLFTLGLAYLQITRPDRALELFEHADQIGGWDSGKEVLQLFRGSALVELGRYPEAAEAYEQSLALGGGEYARAYIGFGNLFFKRGSVDRAVHYYREALDAEGRSPAAYVGAKARFNLGLALVALSRDLGEACDAEEARTVLDDVVAAYEEDPEVDIVRELAFKARYQRGLLAQACADGRESASATDGFREAEAQFRAALPLAEPVPVREHRWVPWLGFDGPSKMEERRWQRDRWIVWKLLGYCQLRLAELGNPELYPDAIASFERVTERFERSLGDVTTPVAAEAYGFLGRALAQSDPVAAATASRRAAEIEKEGEQ